MIWMLGIAFAADLPPELKAFEWMQGRWEGRKGQSTETWVAAGDVWWGVGFGVDPGAGVNTYEALQIGVHEGQVQYVAMPQGMTKVPFPMHDQADLSVTFANPDHDYPKSIHYAAKGETKLAASISAEVGGKGPKWSWTKVPKDPEKSLMDADLQFAADVAKGGSQAWASWFDELGAMYGQSRIEGAGIQEVMADLDRGHHLEWHPVASGLNGDATYGFTVGEWTSWQEAEDGSRTDDQAGSYVTVWKKQADGSWKVWFDTGEPCDSASACGVR